MAAIPGVLLSMMVATEDARTSPHPVDVVVQVLERSCGTKQAWTVIIASAWSLGEDLLTSAIGAAPGAMTIQFVRGRVPDDHLPVLYRVADQELACIAINTQRKNAVVSSSVSSAET